MTAKTVVILSPADDVHALTVSKRVENRGGSTVVLDTADYPSRWQLSMYRGPSGSHSVLHTEDGTISSADVAGVWWRRIYRHQVDKAVTDPKARRFAFREAQSAFRGWLYSLGDRVVNPLTAELAAGEKPYQLHVATQCGLTIPDTCITSSADAAVEFASEHDETIFKTFHGTNWRFLETRRFETNRTEDIDAIRFAPSIFQECIRDSEDIRVTVVGNHLFPAVIRPKQVGAELDWRLDSTSEIFKHELPSDVEQRLLRCMRRLGLMSGAIDLRLTKDGDYVFLEVNPGGQWLFVEIQTGHPISESFADLLLAAGTI